MKHYIGIDLGGTNIAAGVVDGDGKLLASASVPTAAGRETEYIIDDMAETAYASLRRAGLSMNEVERIGVGVPGFLDSARRCVVFSGNVGFHNVALAEQLEKRMGHPCCIENDANAAALGEMYFGAAKGLKNIVLLLLGTGVGSGIIINGQIYKGSDGNAGEIAHTVMDINGEKCVCGQRGCMETLVSASALIRQTKAAIERNPSSLLARIAQKDACVNGKTVFKAAAMHDAAAEEVLDTYTEYLAIAAGNCINIFRPDLLLIGGGLSEAGDALLSPLRVKLSRHAICSSFLGLPRICRAALGSGAGIIGAAMIGEQVQQ